MRRSILVIPSLLVLVGVAVVLAVLWSTGGRKSQLVLSGGQEGGVYLGIAKTIAEIG